MIFFFTGKKKRMRRYRNVQDSYDVVTYFSRTQPAVIASRVVPRPLSNKWLDPVLTTEYYREYMYTKPNIYDSYYSAVHHAYGPSTPLDIKAIKRRELRRYRRRHHEHYAPEDYDLEE